MITDDLSGDFETVEGGGKNRFDARIVYIKLLGRRIDELQTALHDGTFYRISNCLYNVHLLIRPYINPVDAETIYNDIVALNKKITFVTNNKYSDVSNINNTISNKIREIANQIFVKSKDLLLPSNNEQSIDMMDNYFKGK